MNKRRYPKEKIVLTRPLRFRIEHMIGRKWWLGKNLWEFLDWHRESCNHKFFPRKPLRLFNIGRRRRGWALQSPTQRRKENQLVIKY